MIIHDEPVSFQTKADLAEAFSESDLPWKVDVVDWALTDDSFREIIRKKHLVIQPAD